ncbi:MAG: DUF4062 domain-containing protein [Chryseobacterium sp.]|nr:DUF4062 domain-containing protein [Chryseobacterium sp.]
MYDKKHQIFISSTFTDLVNAREEAIKVILNLYQIPIGMEMFSADNDEQWSTIKSTIDSSDYYLLILGHRYGSVTSDGISYTEKEFDYAKSIGVPVISFVKNRDSATKPHERDNDSKLQKALDKFLKKVTKDSMCDFWGTENELGQKIAIALPKIFYKTPRVGWVKSNLSTSIETAEELTKLVQENRELRESLEKYKALMQNDTPNLEVKINDDIPLVLKHGELINRKYQSIDFENIPTHLLKYIIKEDVENFNNKLIGNKIIIDEFNKKENFYNNVKNNSVKLSIEICNIGNAKANDVYVDVKFPEEVVLIENDELKKIEKPAEPKIGVNPVEKALREYNSMKITAPKFYGGGNIVSVDSLLNTARFNVSPINKSYSINKKDNILTIKTSKISHTRKFSLFDKIYIAALEKGKFDIEISIICDEITSPVVFTKEIIVE